MKNKIIKLGIVAIFLVVLLSSITVAYKIRRTDNDQKKIDKISAYTEIIRSRGKRHDQDVKIIHKTGDFIRLGGEYSKKGLHEEAIDAYEKAYSLDRGFRAVSGLLLASEYEKLGQYDKGISLLDQMIQNGELSKNGVKNANALKSRLLLSKKEITSAIAQDLLQSQENVRIGRYQEAEAGYQALAQALKGKLSEAVIHDSLLSLYLSINDRAKAEKECDWLIEHGNSLDKIRGDAVKKDIAYKIRKEPHIPDDAY